MSHTSTTIYIDTNTDPDTGVSVADVQSVLHRGTGDVGLLCSDQEWYDNSGTPTLRYAETINPWAKYKPVRSNLLAILTDANRQDVYFGMSVPIYGSGYAYTNLDNFITAYDSGWSYLRPRGKDYDGNGGNEWYRILDFDGYNHEARCFYYPNGSTLPSEYVYGQTGSVGCTWSLGLNTTSANLKGGIGISDIKLDGSSGTAFSSLYFGLLFVTGTTTKTYKIVTSSVAFGQTGGNEISIAEQNNDGLTGLDKTANYTVYSVLCNSNTRTTPGNVANTDVFVALPVESFSFDQITVATQLVLMLTNASAKWDDTSVKLTVSVYVGMRSTGGTHSIQTILYTIQAASSTSDTTGTQLASGSVGPINDTDPLTAQIYYQGRPTRPNYVRVHVEAYGHSGVEKTQYIAVREGGFPNPDPPSDIT